MRRILIISLIGMVVILAIYNNILAAGPPAPGILERIDRQQERIDRGIASGELTPFEAETVI